MLGPEIQPHTRKRLRGLGEDCCGALGIGIVIESPNGDRDSFHQELPRLGALPEDTGSD